MGTVCAEDQTQLARLRGTVPASRAPVWGVDLSPAPWSPWRGGEDTASGGLVSLTLHVVKPAAERSGRLLGGHVHTREPSSEWAGPPGGSWGLPFLRSACWAGGLRAGPAQQERTPRVMGEREVSLRIASPKVLEMCSPKAWTPTEASAFWCRKSGEGEWAEERIWKTVSARPGDKRKGAGPTQRRPHAHVSNVGTKCIDSCTRTAFWKVTEMSSGQREWSLGRGRSRLFILYPSLLLNRLFHRKETVF